MSTLTPAYIPQLESLSLDARACVFAAGIALASTLLFGIWPALFWSRALPMSAVPDSRGYGPSVETHHRLSAALVVAEVAVTLVLLAAAGLLMRAIGELGRTDPGFTGSNVAVLQVFAYGERYRTDAQRVTFFDRAIEELQAVPGVESVGLVSAMPFAEANIAIRGELRLDGRELPPAGERLTTFVTIANRAYFRAMQMPLHTGRLFTEGDRSGPPVVLINELLARRHWPAADPIGDRITVTWQGKPWTAEVVGVVGALKHDSLDRDYRPELFLPFAQRPFGSMTFVVRSSADAAALMPALKRQVWTVDPTLPFYSTATLGTLVAKSLAPRRFLMQVLAGFSVVAVLLAVAGLYGVLSFVTAQRTREICVRVALGARPADIVRTVVRRGMALAGAGVVLGLAGAFAFTRILGALLFTVSPTDPATLGATTLLLAAVAGIASYVPAHRATRVDPLMAFKAD